MKLFFSIAFVLILLACNSTSSETKAELFINERKEIYKRIFKLIEKNGYVRVQWVDDNLDFPNPVKAAYVSDTPYQVKVENP